MYNCNTDSLGLILGVEVFFSEGHCSGALWGILETILSLASRAGGALGVGELDDIEQGKRI